MPERSDPAGEGGLTEAKELVESETGRIVRTMEDFDDPSQERRQVPRASEPSRPVEVADPGSAG
jgi:hypothetical protein